MRKFLADYPWLAWIAIVVAIRFGISMIGSQVGSRQDGMSEILLQKALDSEDRQIKELALESLYRAAKNLPQPREYILKNLHRRQAQGVLPVPGRQLLSRLEQDPQLVIERAIAGLPKIDLRYLRQLTVKITLALALVLLSLVPATLFFFFGRRGLRRIYGNYPSIKITAVNLLLGTLVVIVILYFPDYLWVVQMAAAAGCLLAWGFLVRSQGLSVFLGTTATNTGRIIFFFLIVLTALFFPYFLPTTTAAVAEGQLVKAIGQLAAEKNPNATMLLRRLLPNASNFSPAVVTQAIAALGELGDQDSLSSLVTFLHSRDRQLQKSALAAIHKILTRLSRQRSD